MLGTVLSTEKSPNYLNFQFQLLNNMKVQVGDFITCKTGNKLPLLGKIKQIWAKSPYFKDPKIIQAYQREGLDISELYPIKPLIIADVDILGVFNGEDFALPRIPPYPGTKVYNTGDHIVKRFLKLSNNGLNLGSIYDKRIPIVLDSNIIFNHHISVIGATGSGKSYFNGVLIEELLKKDISILIIDVHGEYHLLANYLNKIKGNLSKFKIFHPAGDYKIDLSKINGRIEINEFTVNPLKLRANIIAELIKATDPQHDLLFYALDYLNGEDQRRIKQLKLNEENSKDNHKKFDINSLIWAIERMGEKHGFQIATINTLKRKILMLNYLNLFGNDIPMSDFIQKNGITLFDVSQAEDVNIQRTLVATALVRIFNSRKKNKIPPIAIFIEECHIFANQNLETSSKWIIRKIAREGRKFGMCLVLTSQRVIGFDKEALSQCGTKITFRMDSRTDIDYVRPYLNLSSSEFIKILPILPVGTAIISGLALRTPVITSIRERESEHGGKSTKVV